MTLWSVGHSTLSLTDFTDLLATYGVRQVADIRRVPKSRRNPQFDGNALPTGLRQAGIAAHALTPFACVEPDGRITYPGE